MKRRGLALFLISLFLVFMSYMTTEGSGSFFSPLPMFFAAGALLFMYVSIVEIQKGS